MLVWEYMRNKHVKTQKSELEKFKLFFEETPTAQPISARLRRNKAED